jgi:ABC-type sugar transport system ATPase subunit
MNSSPTFASDGSSSPGDEHGAGVSGGEGSVVARTKARATEGEVPLLSLRGVGKSFSGVAALKNVDLDVYAGTVHALLGENGAGKSTLSKVIAGIHPADTGTVTFAGEQVTFGSAADARAAGISFVPQELSIVPERTLAENILMGNLPSRGGMVDRKAMGQRCREILAKLSLDIDPFALAGSFAPGIQQMVMIARGFSLDARFFILDEPTAALTDKETDDLFEVVEAQRKAGTAFVYISHRLEEIARIADEVTVLRDGEWVTTKLQSEMSHDELIRAMVGRKLTRFFGAETDGNAEGGPESGNSSANVEDARPPALAVRGLARGDELHDIDLIVRSGEIVGIAGLLGAGRTELLRAIFGVDRPDTGTVEINGVTARIKSPRDAIRQGVVLVPEERKSQGLVLNLSIAENIAAPRLSAFRRSGWVDNKKIRIAAEEMKERLGVKTPNVGTAVQNLSGGNQQKVVIARWVLSGAEVYLLDEPTRGVDVGAKADIYAVIRELTDQGAAVLVVSSELPELIGLCDRILVMREGRIVDEVPQPEFSEERLLASAMGHTVKGQEQ